MSKNSISALEKEKKSSSSSSERRSLHFQLRSSLRLLAKGLRLLGKPAMSLVRRTGKRRERDHSVEELGHASYVGRGKRDGLGSYMRWDRKVDAEGFRNNYIYDDSSIDTKVYINSSGDTNWWKDRSVGCLWVAVYGKTSMCVAWKGDLELKRFPMCRRLCTVRRLFALNVISEVEDIARSNKDSRQTLDKPVKRPFAVVSLIPSTTDVHQESGDEVIEASGAVKYLKERMSSALDFDRIEAIQTAISALQRQCNQEFTADDIWVCVLEEGTDSCLRGKEIEEHLAEINKPKPLQSNEIEGQASSSSTTIVEAPLQTSEIETSEIKELK